MKLLLPLLLALGMLTCCSPGMAAEGNGTQAPARLEAQVDVTLNYLLYLPENYDEQERWPLLLFLHGAGERGDDLELVKTHGPPRLIAEGRQFPFIVVSPQCPADTWWEPIELLALIDAVSKQYHVDADRVYCTGLSMGGFGTWRLAAHAPERLAAIAPICGGGETHWAKRAAFVELPAWAFHGALDKAVPVERSEAMVAALKKAGGEPKLTIYPDTPHDSWTETYNNPELYEWLLSHQRNQGQ